jgi:hypothetical protein
MSTMTNKTPSQKPDDPAQYKRFLEAAKKAEADETEKGADRAFKKVAARKDSKPIRRP